MHWTYWVFYGAMGASVLMVAANFMGLFDLEMDHDVDHDVDHDIDADHDADHDHSHTGFSFLSLLGVGKVPLSVLLMTWLMTFGVAGTTWNASASSYDWFPGAGVLSLLIAFVVSLFVGGAIARFVGKHVPSTETYTKTKEDLIACDGQAATSPPPGTPDLSRVVEEFYGSGLYLAVARDRSSVLASAPDPRELVQLARAQGLENYVIVKAPKGPYKAKIYGTRG